MLGLKSISIQPLWLHYASIIVDQSVAAPVKESRGYANGVLVILFLVYVLNFLDRQILAILAEDIKADLQISDADLGFLYGTAFAVFYATFGIPLGRLADAWNRTHLISLGLGFWSLMTALSGTAKGFASLATYRFGVGIGESSASPAALSLLYDYYPPHLRTTVVALYAGGVYIGLGCGLFLGGSILDAWAATYPDTSLAPFGLKGWQVAFMAVGLPGLLLSLVVAKIREPERGRYDGGAKPIAGSPLKEVAVSLGSMVPVLNLFMLARGGAKPSLIIVNVVTIALLAVLAWGLILLTGDVTQWVALAIGVFAAFSWSQSFLLRDPDVFHLLFRSRAMICLTISAAGVVFVGVAFAFWSVPLIQRTYEVANSQVGMVVGLSSAVSGFCGITFGGILADRLRQKFVHGKLVVYLAATVGAIIMSSAFLFSTTLISAYACLAVLFFFTAMATGPAMATINDLNVPRGRATSYAFFTMVTTLIGTAIGPYLIGQVSDVYTAGGASPAEALRLAMIWCLALPVGGLLFGIIAFRALPADEARVREQSERELLSVG